MIELIKAVDKYKDLIFSAEKYIWKNPETGYFEYKTNKYMAEQFKSLGYSINQAGDIPGFYTVFDTGRAGPTLLIFAEMDSIIIDSHPECDKITKAVHACGHNAQCAAILGVAAVLKEIEKENLLSGKIKFCIVPAEEAIEFEKREELCRKGIIKYGAGKQEFMSRGYFNDCDLAFMLHSRISEENEKTFFVTTKGSNGVIRKIIKFIGKSAHAGSGPEKGINALYAANLALDAVNALRETFKDEDHIRSHSIISKGGLSVNAVPDEVIIESYVRGGSTEAIKNVNKKINRALAGCALAMGANVSIQDRIGFLPLNNNNDLQRLALKAVEEEFGADSCFDSGEWLGSSTDMGDISAVMPAMHGYINGGVAGTLHGNDFRITDAYRACVDSAKIQLCLIEKLLSDNAEEALKIIESNKGKFKSVSEVLSIYDQINKDKLLLDYKDEEVTFS